MNENQLLSLTESIAREAAFFEDASDLDEFLQKVISLTVDYIGASVAEVFLYEHATGHLVLKAGASKGGDPAPSIRHFGLDENIAGQAFQEGRVIHESHLDPSVDYPFASNIAIPIHHGPEKVGVLLLAHPQPGYFGAESENALKTVASHFGSVLENASLLLKSEESAGEQPNLITGLTASTGVAVGSALPFGIEFEDMTSGDVKVRDVADSLELFDVSLKLTLRQLEDLQSDNDSPVHDMAALIFSSYMLMLNDESFTGKMKQRIADGQTIEDAISGVVNEYTAIFASMRETRFSEKAQDVRDLGYRLLKNLEYNQEKDPNYHGQIAIARHIYPSDLIRLAAQNIAGIVLMGVGVTAHIAILARTLELPVMLTDDRSILRIKRGAVLILDATKARLYAQPDEELLRKYRERLSGSNALGAIDRYTIRGSTKDGIPVSVSANINLYSDAEEGVRQGAEGIGLYRSEFPFIIKNDFLTEEQQYQIYRKVVTSMPGKPVLLRTADIGGDKLMEGRDEEELNPFLGVRGIRFSLANREMFREQLRAMLRAGVGSELGIMLPMVSSVEEVLEAKREISFCIAQLREEGVAHISQPRIGAMVELPSAAMAIDDLASETDFLSIGTNDLIMYLLAVDRTNDKLSHLYKSYHPIVLRTLARIAVDAGPMIREMSVCGDSASDPLVIPFFVGIGIHKLSVEPHKVEKVKRYLSHFSLEDTKAISAEMLELRKIDEMDEYLHIFKKRFPVEILG